MTITASAPTTSVETIFLTEHDTIVNSTRGGFGKTLPASDAPVSLSIAVHPKPETAVLVRVHPAERRIVLSLGTLRADLVMYLDAEQIDRFVNVLSAARKRLPN